MGLTRRSIGNFFGIGLPKDYRSFEDPFSNKSRCYSLNHDFGFNFPEPSIGAYLFGNGACNTFDDLGEKAHRISTYSGYNTRGVYNATHSPLIDGHCDKVSDHMLNQLAKQMKKRCFSHQKYLQLPDL